MKTVKENRFEFDIEASPILRFEFNEEIRMLISDRIQFDPEESNLAPGPSIACILESEMGLGYIALYLQYVPELDISAEKSLEVELAISEFLREIPEMLPYLKWRHPG
jgi:hypothetical protein